MQDKGQNASKIYYVWIYKCVLTRRQAEKSSVLLLEAVRNDKTRADHFITTALSSRISTTKLIKPEKLLIPQVWTFIYLHLSGMMTDSHGQCVGTQPDQKAWGSDSEAR